MPPKSRVDKKTVTDAALEFVREKGMDALNARALAEKIGCSTQPIFYRCGSMEEIKNDVKDAARAMYLKRLHDEASKGKYPPYKASGIGYVAFAREESELFKCLFMGEGTQKPGSDFNSSVAYLEKQLGLTHDTAVQFQIEMWIFVHGIAVMYVSHSVDWSEEYVSRLMTDMYEALQMKFTKQA